MTVSLLMIDLLLLLHAELNVTHIDVYREESKWKFDAVVKVSINHYIITYIITTE